MLDIPQEFFLEEVREDFTIDSTMKTFWAAELEVLREIAEVCERHNIQWYAAFGTLLGAIRHEGFVPWDDDMDIWMKREDYDRFMEIAPKELPEEYVVQSPLTERGYTQFHSCVFNALTISITSDRLRNFHGCPFATGIDVFPLDYLPRDEEVRESQKALYVLMGTLVDLLKKEEKTEEDEETFHEGLDVVAEVTGVTNFQRELFKENEEGCKPLLTEIYKLMNRLCASYGEADGDELVMYMDYINYGKRYPKELFDEVVQVPFEGFLIPAPAGYDAVLRRTYGNYEVRVRSTTMHDYPLYNRQLKHLREVTEDLEGKITKLHELIARGREKQMREGTENAEISSKIFDDRG